MSWWLRAPAVLIAPRPVFLALRDESVEDAEDRQEPLAALLAFIAGVLYAVAAAWLGGGLLFGAARRFGSLGSYRRARHVLELAAAPLALSLLVFWPVRIAIYGRDLFRTGGDDFGRGDTIF